MPYKNVVLESAEYVAHHSKDVQISFTGLESAAKKILGTMKKHPYSTQNWSQHILHPKLSEYDPHVVINWIFVMDLLNFSFWNERSVVGRKPFSVTLDKVAYTGYWSLCACLQRAMRKGIRIVDPPYYAQATHDELKAVFSGDESEEAMDLMPLLDTRIELLHRAGKIINEDFNGSFVNCIQRANGSTQSLISLIITHFGDIFDDTVQFVGHGRAVSFHKRVQILVADLWACFNGEGFGRFEDIDSITMFADYRVPQALVSFGLIEYSEDLKARLKRDWVFHSTSVPLESFSKQDNEAHMIPRGHRYEIEIRGCSIWVVELLLRKMKDLDPEQASKLNAILIDFYLWDEAKEKKEEMKHIDIHLTRSIYY